MESVTRNISEFYIYDVIEEVVEKYLHFRKIIFMKSVTRNINEFYVDAVTQ